MTPKQIRTLNWLLNSTMDSEYLKDDDKIERVKQVAEFLRMARDFYLIKDNRDFNRVWKQVFELKKEEKTA